MKCVSVYSTNSLGPGKLVSNEDISKSIIIICSSMTTWKVFGTFMLLLFTLMTLLLLLFFSPLEMSAIPNHPYYATIFILHIDLLYLTTVLKNYMFGVPRIRNKRSLIRRTEGIWQVVYHDEERCLYNAVNFLQNAPVNTQSSPVSARFGVFVVILISDSLSATVIAVSCVIPWSIRPRYSALDAISHCDLNLKFRPDGVCNVTKT